MQVRNIGGQTVVVPVTVSNTLTVAEEVAIAAIAADVMV